MAMPIEESRDVFPSIGGPQVDPTLQKNPFMNEGPVDSLKKLLRLAGLGLATPEGFDFSLLGPELGPIVQQMRVPSVYTPEFKDTLFTQGGNALAGAQRSRSQDLGNMLTTQFGIGSGVGADFARQNMFDESAQIAQFQTELERQFREAQVNEMLQRLMSAQGLMSGQIAAPVQREDPFSKYAESIGSMIGGIGSVAALV